MGGFAAGFVLNTTTVEVVGLCEVLTSDGVVCPARQSGIRAGDVIEKLNDMEINSIGDLNLALNQDYKSYCITVMRAEGEQSMQIEPAIDKATGQKKLGILVKDSVNGIGTVTFVDKKSKKFGSLGHPVTDSNKNMMQINGGTIYSCLIYGIKKGVRGNPGELKGTIESNYLTGVVTKNCACGIFGEL
ncbi:MAG: SpoIVB peptidase S55 domain-containing protein, partial [Candidatus Coproplasma sp.]